GETVVGYRLTGELPERIGNGHPLYAPHGVFQCAPTPGVVEEPGELPLPRAPGAGNTAPDDEGGSWVAIACTTDDEFATLCRVIGRPGMPRGAPSRAAGARRAHQEGLTEPITVWTIQRDHRTAMEELQAAAVPAGAVLSVAEVFQDPQLRARGFFEQI